MTPLVAHKVADILSEAGLPDSLFQIIHGTHEIGRAICEHPGIAKVSLTGGVATGKLIMSQTASTLKKITLELGGNVWVNSFNILPPGMPFGGAKHSGFGRENSIYTLDAYSEVKSVHITL
jgi:acyl-CoA reductase-like NAD-dependent aldehyde dehydrogenase